MDLSDAPSELQAALLGRSVELDAEDEYSGAEDYPGAVMTSDSSMITVMPTSQSLSQEGKLEHVSPSRSRTYPHHSDSRDNSLRIPTPSSPTPSRSESVHSSGSGNRRKPFNHNKHRKLYEKMKYYSKLSSKESTALVDPPSHVLPAYVLPSELYTVISGGERTQSSITTIFSIWNTMMGSSLLSMPWGFSQAGLTGGLCVMAFMGFVCFYTCNMIIKMNHGSTFKYADLFQICMDYLGRYGQVICWASSLLLCVGALMAYNILISDSLFHGVNGLYMTLSGASSRIGFLSKTNTALIIFGVLLPLCSLKERTFFVKLNSFGLAFVTFICGFILFKSYEDSSDVDTSDFIKTPELKIGTYSFAGVLILSFFCHNAILAIMKNQRHPEKNSRDLLIAFCLVGMTYAIIGVSAYIRFGHDPTHAMDQDFLNRFSDSDVGASIARICLLLQLSTVYPLILYVIRIQFYGFLINKQYPGFMRVAILNSVCITATTLITLFYPNVGDIQRITGVICGFFMIFLLPVGVYLSKHYHHLVPCLPTPEANIIEPQSPSISTDANTLYDPVTGLPMKPPEGFWATMGARLDVAMHISLIGFGILLAYVNLSN